MPTVDIHLATLGIPHRLVCASMTRPDVSAGMTRALAVWLGTVVLAPAAVAAQQTIVFFRTDADRWVNGRQRPAFTAMTKHDHRIRLEQVSDTADGHRAFDFTFTQHIGQPGSAHVVTDSYGRILQIQAQFHELRKVPGPPLVAPETELEWEVFDGTEQSVPSVPDTRFWDIIPVVRARRLAKGVHWVDTLDLAATLEGFRQTLQGIRTSVVLGDTVVAGAKLWIVRDSAMVAYAERFPSAERSLEGGLVTLQGAATFDAAPQHFGLFRVRRQAHLCTGRGHALHGSRLSWRGGCECHRPARACEGRGAGLQGRGR
jgi:hypothetical protein